MKKLLGAAVVFVLSLVCASGITACKKNEDSVNDAEVAKKAITQIRTLYADKATETASDYTVIGQAKVDEGTYNVSWSISSEFENYSNYLSVGDMDETTKLVTISVKKATEVIEYKLTASVTVGEATETASFNRSVPAGKDRGDAEMVYTSISFATTSTRTSQTTEQQVWEENGVKLTNDKASSANSVGNYAPIRIYQGSSVKLEYPGLVNLVFHCPYEEYVAPLVASLQAAYADAEVNSEGTDVTIELAVPVNELEFSATAQIRLTSIEIEAYKDGVTDEQKVAGAKSALTVAVDRYLAVGEYALTTSKNGATISWASSNTEYVSITSDGKLKVEKLPAEAGDEVSVTLTATLTAGEVSDTKTFTVKVVSPAPAPVGTLIMGIVQASANKTVYFAGGMDDKYGATTEDPLNAAYVTIAEVDGGYTLKVGDKYIETTYYTANTGNFVLSDSSNGVWKYSSELETFTWTITDQNVTYYLGTYGSNTNVRVSSVSYISGSNASTVGVSQFVVFFTEPVADTRTDAEKVDAALAQLTFANTEFIATQSVALPIAGVNGVSVSWNIPANDYVEISDGNLVIKALPDTETTLTLTATATCGEASTPKTFEIKVSKPVEIENGDYILALDQNDASINKTLYFAGTVNSSNFAETTEDIYAAATVTVTKVEGGYTMKVGDKYLQDNGSGKLELAETATNLWGYDYTLKAWTSTIGSDVRYLGTFNAYNTLCLSYTSYISGSNANKVGVSQFIAYLGEVPVDDRSDDEVVASVKSALEAAVESFTEYYIATAENIALPASNNEDVTVTWSVETNDYVEVADNLLTIKAIPTTAAEVEVTLTATITYGNAQAQTVTLTIVVCGDSNRYGSLETPLSVAQTLALAEEECTANGDVTQQVVYMKGVLTNAPTDRSTYYQNLYVADLEDASKEILVYAINLREGVAAPAQNDELVVCGYITLYVDSNSGKETLEFATKNNTYTYLESNKRGTSTITVEATNATVDIPETATNGTEVSFTVEAAEGYQVASVKVGTTLLEAENGTYSFTVSGNATVKVETVAEGEKIATVLNTLSFTAEAQANDTKISSYTASYDAVRGDYTYTIANFNNNNLGWTSIKTGHKTNEVKGSITTKDAVASTVTQVILNIVVTDANLASIKSIKLYVSTSAEFGESDTTVIDATIKSGEIAIDVENPGENYFYRVEIDCTTGSANGFVQLDSLVLMGYAD